MLIGCFTVVNWLSELTHGTPELVPDVAAAAPEMGDGAALRKKEEGGR
jgi:hypothetical protein